MKKETMYLGVVVEGRKKRERERERVRREHGMGAHISKGELREANCVLGPKQETSGKEVGEERKKDDDDTMTHQFSKRGFPQFGMVRKKIHLDNTGPG